jgi:hypothetical protein
MIVSIRMHVAEEHLIFANLGFIDSLLASVRACLAVGALRSTLHFAICKEKDSIQLVLAVLAEKKSA